MRFLKKFFRSDGFTLTELMVVVGVAGILTAVGIPTFKTYQAKSKTVEAKVSLASIYSAEATFMSEFDTYASCLDVAGYSPGSVANRYYAVGFKAKDAAVDQVAQDNGANGCVADANYAFSAGKSVGGSVVTAAALGAYPSLIVSSDGASFIAGALGQVSSSVGSSNDYWTMSDRKSLNQLHQGY